mgnify:CR=1 FL=1
MTAFVAQHFVPLMFAGLFFFLPAMASALLVPELSSPAQPAAPPDADPQLVMQAMMDQMTAAYAAIASGTTPVRPRGLADADETGWAARLMTMAP